MKSEPSTLIDMMEEKSAHKDICLPPMRVAQDIMSTDVKTLTLDHTVRQCLQFMDSHRVRHAPVVDPPYGKEGKACFIGVVSQRDVLRVNASEVETTDKEKTDKRALRQVLAQIVARKPKSASLETPIRDVIVTMISNHIDMIPVIRDGDVAGIITTTDLLKLFFELEKTTRQFCLELKKGTVPGQMDSEDVARAEILLSWVSQTVLEIMTEELVCLEPQDSLARAIEVMQEMEIRHVPIVDAERRLLGLVSDRDILRNLPYLPRRPASPPKRFRDHLFMIKSSTKCLEWPLESIMRRKVLQVAPDCGIIDAAGMLYGDKISCLPVLDHQGNLRGIVTVTDLMRALLAVYEPMSKPFVSSPVAVDSAGSNGLYSD